MANIPDNIKRNVRAVLLSKKGGVLVSDFTQDYKTLLKEQLRYKDYGFNTVKEFIDGMPDVVRLEFDDYVMAYKMFGVGDPNTYMSLSQKNAEKGLRGRSSPDKRSPTKNSSTKSSNTSLSCSLPDLEDKLIPNARGHISICYDRRRESENVTEEEIREKFSEFGNVVEVHMIPRLIFVRYMDKEAVIAAINRYETELGCRVAEEKLTANKKSPQPTTNGSLSDTSDSMLVKKPSSGGQAGRGSKCYNCNEDGHVRKDCPQMQGGSICYNCKGVGHFSRECPNKNNSSQTKRHEKDGLEVFLGNIPLECTEEEVNELAAEFDPSYVRRVIKREDKKHFAFAGFSTMDQAESMINKLSGYSWKGRSLICRMSNVDPPKSTGKGSSEPSEQSLAKISWRSPTAATSDSDVQASRSNSNTQNEDCSWDDDIDEGQSHKWNSIGGQGQKEERTPSWQSSTNKPLISPAKFAVSPSANMKSPTDPSSHFQQLSIKTNFNESSRSVTSPSSSTGTRGQVNRPSPRIQNGYDMAQGGSPPFKGMPSLEPVDVYNDASMPPLELAVSDMPGQETLDEGIVGVFVGNFPYGISDGELLRLFQDYSPQFITMFNRDDYSSSFGAHSSSSAKSCAKAMVYINGMGNARRAVNDLNQTFYKGRRLLVDIDKNHPDYEENKAVYEVIESRSNQNQRHYGSYQQGYPSHQQAYPGYQQAYQANPMGRQPGSYPYGEYPDRPYRSPPKSTGQSTHSDLKRTASETSVSSVESVKQRSFSSVLQTFKIIVNSLDARRLTKRPEKGTEILVLVTSVFDQEHFWAHIVTEDSIQNLETIMMHLQDPDTRIGFTKGLGRCAAKLDNEWFRAWIIADLRSTMQADVFYIDYGNMARVPKRETSLTVPDVWELPLNLFPFKLAAGSQPLTRDLESKLVRLSVTRVAIDETGYLSEATLSEILS